MDPHDVPATDQRAGKLPNEIIEEKKESTSNTKLVSSKTNPTQDNNAIQ